MTLYGEKHPGTHLTEADIRLIRALWTSGGNVKQRELAEMFNVSRASISLIVTRKRWQHVV